MGEGRDVHEIVGDDTEADPAVHAVFTMVATAVESVSAFEHADAAFTAGAPPLPATEPALAFKRTSRRRFRATPRQDHTSNAAIDRRLLIGRRAEAAIAGGQARCATEDGLMTIEGRRPQGRISRSPRMHLIGGDDLMFRFLNGHQRAKLVGRSDFAFADRFCMRLEEAQELVGHVGVPADDPPRMGLRQHPLDERPHVPELILRAPQGRLDLWLAVRKP